MASWVPPPLRLCRQCPTRFHQPCLSKAGDAKGHWFLPGPLSLETLKRAAGTFTLQGSASKGKV